MFNKNKVKLENFLDFFEKNNINLIAGESGAGKTNFLLYLSKKFEKPLIIDTENGVSSKRIQAFKIKNLNLIKTKNSTSLEKIVNEISSLKKYDFIGIDSISFYYRLKLIKNVDEANKWLVNLLGKLFENVENKTIVLIDHVYRENNLLKLSGGDIVKYFSKTIFMIEKKKDNRKIKIVKHISEKEGKYALFKINEGGLIGI